MYQPNYWILERSYCFLPKWTTGDREWKWGVRLGYRVSLLGLYTCSFGLVWPEVTSKAGATVPPGEVKGHRSGQRWNVLGCYWSEGMSLSASALEGCPGEGVWGGCETGAMPWARGRDPATMPSTPAPAPGSPPAATPISPAGNLQQRHVFTLKYADTVKARAVTINQYRIDSWIVSDIFRMHRILSGIDSDLRF